MDYAQYTAEDFAADPDFIAWVKQPSPELNMFWSAWQSRHPHKRAEINRGRQIVLALEIEEVTPDDGFFLNVWADIVSVTRSEQPGPLEKPTGWLAHTWHGVRRYYLMAAMLSFAVVAGVYLYISESRKVVVATHYGESRTLVLPDSTKITLNANSRIRYNRFSFSHGDREVWLDGEAFFAVSRTLNNDHFVVHTKELQVKVLGTRFNVNSRRGNTKVVLDEGKVKLDMNGLSEPLYMNPGELVEFSGEAGIVLKKPVEPQEYTAWRHNRITFNSASLQEIAAFLEDTYGFQVTLKGARLGDRSFTGSSSSEDVQELLGKLRDLFNLNIIQHDHHIIIQEKDF